nr:integrase, catalytic region, zinc finger, CCHC-type, peptidase aspartic, catalytic [Tanacetum cinerariifolium]
MALVLMAKAFKLNYSTPTNNNQRISSSPRNRQIAQPGMNMGQDRQMQMVSGNGGNQFRQYAGNPAGYNDVIRNQGNAAGQNGNQIRCYNCRGVGHYARNCTVRPKRRDAAYLQTQLLISQKEEAGIQLQVEEYDLMAAAADLDEIKEVNANCILMANLQQASTSGTQTDSAPVYDTDRSAEVHENFDDNEIFNMFTQEEQYTELLEPIPESHQVPQNDNDVISENTNVKQGGETIEQHSVNFEETRALYESLYQNLAIEVEKVNSINRKLKETNADLTTELVKSTIVTLQRVVKQRMTIETHNWASSAHQELHKILREEIFPIVNQVNARVQNFKIQFLKEAAKFVGDFKSLVNEADAFLAKHKALEIEIERLLKAVVSHDIMIIVQNESVVDTSDLQTELECTKERFENYIIKKETEYAKLWNDWYKKYDECKYDKIPYDKAYKDMQQKIVRLQARVGDLKGKSKDTSSVSDTQNPLSQKLKNKNVELEFHVLNYARENAHLKATYKNMFDSISVINPDKTSREAKKVPNTVRASARTKPITVSQPHVIAKKDVNSDLNGLSSTGVDNTKTRRPQPRSNTKHDRVSFASKSSRSKNKEAEKQKAKVSVKEIQMKYQPKVTKPKKVEHHKSLATPKPRKPRFLLRWSPTGRLFDQEGNLKLLINFVWKFMGTVRFGNDHVAAILGFGDLQWGNILITGVYFVEGLGHNLFSVDSFYHTEQKMALGYQNPFYLKKAQKKQQSLYDGKSLLEKNDPPVVHDLEETLMTIETHNWSSSAHQELYKIVKDENFPIVNQVDAIVQNFKIQFLKEAAKFVGDFKSLVNEADASLAKHKALELEIEHLLKAVVSQDIMNIMQKESVINTSDLQTELERTKERFENCIIKKENEYAKLWNDWINLDKTSREEKNAPNTISPSARTKPITVSQPTVFIKRDVNSDLNGLSSTEADNTKTRRPQLRSNKKHDRVPSPSKSSRSKNKEAEVEEHHRNLLLSKNNKHMSSACNNIKLDSQDVISKVVCAMCCSKHMTGNLKLLINFVWKFMGTVRFGNDHVAVILGFGDLQ